MPDEKIVAQIEELLSLVANLGGSRERTGIIPNLEVLDNAPIGLTDYVIVADSRDDDAIPAVKVPGVEYAIGDLVNVLFIDGTEPIAFQQGSGSSGSNTLWKVIAGGADIYYNAGDVQIGAATTPATALEVSGDITIADDIIHKGDTDTLISFQTDQINVQAAEVGINQASPTTQLDVLVNSADAIPTGGNLMNVDSTILRLFNESDTATYSGFGLHTRTTNSSRVLIGLEHQNNYQGDLFFRFRDAAGSSSEVMRLTYAGDLGLTVDPSTRLDISDGAMEFDEMTAPAAGAANSARLFAQDNGAGKTQLAVRFSSGAIQILATEP